MDATLDIQYPEPHGSAVGSRESGSGLFLHRELKHLNEKF